MRKKKGEVQTWGLRDDDGRDEPLTQMFNQHQALEVNNNKYCKTEYFLAQS
jgi:hypothetical protein